MAVITRGWSPPRLTPVWVAAIGALVLLLTFLIGTDAAAAASFTARGSAKQVYVTGLTPDGRASLINSSGRTVRTQRADSLGGLLFRNVSPGKGYRVRLGPSGTESPPLTVHSDAAAPWDPGVYKQAIKDNGYQYLTTRDGIKLAINVHPPTHPAGEPGGPPVPPFPTLIEYSGYGYARPGSTLQPEGPVNGIAVLANLMGFAVVDVNMRGTGCSAGAYDFFEPLQNLDGYDVVETIAHQPWVLHHKVGMMGISYGAISQLFTAQLDPPDLAAISPLSTIDATATTLYPGGILNTGFAVAWALQRQYEARPAGPHGGQPYAYDQIKKGDKTCKANQVLHGEAANLPAKIKANSHYRPKVADPLDPISFVHKIKVPVFMACQFTDEQTGGHCPDLVQHMTGTKLKWFTFTNGVHADSLDPYTYNRWEDFLELFVAQRPPIEWAAPSQAASPAIYQAVTGSNDFWNDTLPPDPIQAIPTYSAALAAFKKLPEVRVLFDNGAGKSPNRMSKPGDPYPGFEHSFSSLPVPGTRAQRWFFGPGGRLNSKPPKREAVNWYTSNAKALPLADYKGNTSSASCTGTSCGDGEWANASQWTWNWKPNPPGTAVSYVTAPLRSNTTVIGAGAIHVWVRSATPDVDLQATITEVRPDGKETFVQNGWIRASERKLDASPTNIFKQRSTLLAPIPSMRAADVQPMPKNRFVEVVVPLYYEGHAYRKGSRIRVTIAGPNGTQPIWSFKHTKPKTPSKVWVAFSKSMPSSLFLPVVPGLSVPTGLPPCPSLRNEPCRPYVASTNRTAAPPKRSGSTGSSRKHRRSRRQHRRPSRKPRGHHSRGFTG